MMQQILMKLVGLWVAFLLATSAATVSPSILPTENTKLTPSSSALGPVYREARDYNGYESGGGYNYRSYDRPQQSRCISCLYAAMNGNQDRNRPGYSSYGMMPIHAPQRETEDRNWYYQSDDRNRNTQYENRYPQQNRYDYSRPGAMPGAGGSGVSGGSGGYDRNDYRQNYQDYRGNGYDNRDPAYYSMKGNNRGGYGNRDGSYESYYDDRMSNRGYSSSAGYSGSSAGYGGNNYYMRPSYQSSMYDQDRYYGQGRPYERPTRPEYYDKNMGYGSYSGYSGNRGGGQNAYGYEDNNFRPWDQTYRGVSGFDDQGHGHYYAKYPSSPNVPSQPPLPQNNQHQQAPPRPFPQQQGGHHESSSQSQPTYGSESVSGSGNSNSDKGSYGGSWNYINSNDRNSAHHGQQGYGQSQDKENQSSPYGQRPLSTSYLYERDTPTVVGETHNGDNGSDTNVNANQAKQAKVTTTKSYDYENSKTDSTDKINTITKSFDEANTVSTPSKDSTDQ
ncbi:stress protein DDR48-like isoform X2 [Contarinia nasturtii]|uniref:stress protein DDR48-like isoform X2 n=1 Tax=Contarinia nasturtii TaxID=265458 RepID=UPI0012D37825|nr:stress protein DDR48-like isoform X2 [Contarinia nasturtii]